MGKNEQDVLAGSHGMQVVVENPADVAAKKKITNKLNAMRIAQTHIEIQGMKKVSPKKATEIADEFLEWLEK
jgi:hypothetical protein